MASSAAGRDPKVTKPNPRGRDVPRSIGRKTSVTAAPKAPNTSRRRGSSVAVYILNSWRGIKIFVLHKMCVHFYNIAIKT